MTAAKDNYSDDLNVYVFLGVTAKNINIFSNFISKKKIQRSLFISNSQELKRRLSALGHKCEWNQAFPGVGKAGEIDAYKDARKLIDRTAAQLKMHKEDKISFLLMVNELEQYLGQYITFQKIIEFTGSSENRSLVFVTGSMDDFWLSVSSRPCNAYQAERQQAFAEISIAKNAYSDLEGFSEFAEDLSIEWRNAQSECIPIAEEFLEMATNRIDGNPVLICSAARLGSNYFKGLKSVLSKMGDEYIVLTFDSKIHEYYNSLGWNCLYFDIRKLNLIQTDFSYRFSCFFKNTLKLIPEFGNNKECIWFRSCMDSLLISHFFKRSFTNSHKVFFIIQQIIERLRPRSTFLIPYVAKFHKAFELAALQSEIPTFTMATAGLPAHARGVPWINPKTKFFIYGTHGESSLLKMGHPEHQIVLTGNPVYDYIFNLSHSNRESIDFLSIPGKKVILAATSGIIDAEIPWMRVVAQYCEIRNYTFVIKPHPSLSVSEYVSRLPGSCLVTQDNSLLELIYDCDLMITDWSSAGFEASLLNKPFLIANFTGTPFPYNYEKDGVAVLVTELTQLTSEITSLLEDETKRKKLFEHQCKNNQKYNYLNDGKAGERISGYLLVQKKRPNEVHLKPISMGKNIDSPLQTKSKQTSDYQKQPDILNSINNSDWETIGTHFQLKTGLSSRFKHHLNAAIFIFENSDKDKLKSYLNWLVSDFCRTEVAIELFSVLSTIEEKQEVGSVLLDAVNCEELENTAKLLKFCDLVSRYGKSRHFEMAKIQLRKLSFIEDLSQEQKKRINIFKKRLTNRS